MFTVRVKLSEKSKMFHAARSAIKNELTETKPNLVSSNLKVISTFPRYIRRFLYRLLSSVIRFYIKQTLFASYSPIEFIALEFVCLNDS